MTNVRRITDGLEKPSLDDRSYRVIELGNKLQALLVHDPETDKASASMNVNVGSFSDDDSMPGMAHAVEHLLFMGTKKYPVENEYSSFLSSHSGHSNAYTAPTQTNYFFECAASSEGDHQGTIENGTDRLTNGDSSPRAPFYGALDRFAQFFVEPLFLESTLDRELRAVDSENKKNLQSDQWRLMQLSKTLSNPRHPYSKFSTGNLETLRDIPESKGVQIRQTFIEFYQKHYSANLMKLVVLGKEPLDQLESWVAHLFAAVANKDLAEKRWDGVEQPFTSAELSTQVYAKPVMEDRRLDLCFPYQDEEEMYDSQPSRYLGHLLGHEGPGSVLAYLKEKGWANGLACGYNLVCPGTAFFDVEIRLTPDGFRQRDEVLQVVFQYISLMKQQPPQEWVFDEMKKMGEVNFRFQQKSRASTFTRTVSSIMQKPVPRDWLLSALTRLRRFDAKAITAGMQYLRPDNFRLTACSHDQLPPLDQTEKWYGTEYTVQKIPVQLAARLEESMRAGAADRPTELHLPEKNEFIPSKLDVEKKEVAEPAKAPKLVRDDGMVRLWWKKDDRFWVPKSNVVTVIRSPSAYTTPANSVKTRLFCSLVKDSLSEYAYDADICGLEYGLEPTMLGVTVTVGGYSDKLPILLEKVVRRMKGFVINEARFAIIKERLSRSYKNWGYGQPYGQAGVYTRWLTQEQGWNVDEVAAELPAINVDDVQAFIPHILGANHVEMLAHGDLGRPDAIRVAKMVEEVLAPRPLSPSLWYRRRKISLPPGSDFVYHRTLADAANVNHAIEYNLFLGDRFDRVIKAKAQLLAQMTIEPTFDRLRTKEQLGYVVFSGARAGTDPTAWYRVLIQSEREPSYLETRIDHHLIKFAAELDGMSDTDFEAHRRSLINSKREKHKNLDAETGHLSQIIESELYDFDKLDADVAELKRLSKADMQHFYRDWIDPRSLTRAKLSVHLIAQAKADADVPAPLLPEQQIESVFEAASKVLSSVLGTGYTPESFRQELQSVKVISGDQEGVVAAMKRHVESATSAKHAESIESQVRETIAAVFEALGLDSGGQSPDEAAAPAMPNGETAKAPPTVITDVNAWKAGLRISEAPRPLVDLGQFGDVEPKL